MMLHFELLDPWKWSADGLARSGPHAVAAAVLASALLFALPLLLHLRPRGASPVQILGGVCFSLGFLVSWMTYRAFVPAVPVSADAPLPSLPPRLGWQLLALLPWALPAALAGLTVWGYLGVKGATPRRIAAVLALRLTAFALVIVAVTRPTATFTGKEDAKKPRLFVAVDASLSMNILDEFDNQSRWNYLLRNLKEAAPAFQKLRDAGVEVTFVRFADKPGPFDPDEPGKADGKRTDIGLLLARLYEDREAERTMLGLLLLTDGADNGGKDHPPLTEAVQWARLPCPIHCFAYGKTTTRDVTKDVIVRELLTPGDAVPIKGEMKIKVRVDAPGFQGQAARLKVLLDSEEIKAEDVRLTDAEDNLFEIKCNAPGKPGEYRLTVKVEDPRRPGEPLPGQVSRQKSEQSTFITVTKEGISVLLVDKPRAVEPQLICDALAREPRIRVFPVWLRGDRGAGADGGDLFQFDRQQYDVVIFGDVTAAQVRAVRKDALEALEGQVDRGAGFLMLGGYASFGNGDWDGTPIVQLLPAALDVRGQEEREVKMVPTEAGLRRFGYLLSLADRAKESKDVWDKLPKLEGATRLGKPKPNVASVLAETDKGDPLLMARDYGKGRVLAFGGDTTYRWERTPEGVAAHDRFWQRLVIWLARQEETESRAWVKLGTRRLPARNDLNFTMGLRNKGGVEVKDGKYTVEVHGPNDFKAVLTPKRIGGEDGGVFDKTEGPGEYRVVVKGEGKGPDGEEVKGEASARFLIYDDDPEQSRRAADHEFLKKLAAAGGGQFQRAEKLAEFVERLQAQPRKDRARGYTFPDWQTRKPSLFLGVFLLLFVAVVGVEWLLRRRWGWV